MNYSKINLFDIANGNGLRVSLFVSGCKFNCEGCFNPAAHDFNFGKEYTEETKNLILERLKNKDFEGLSILGGDPLWQDEEGIKQLVTLCTDVHHLGKNIWIWSGYTWEDLWDNTEAGNFMKRVLIQNCDYFVDGRFQLQNRDASLPWRGSSNQRIIDVKASTKENVVLWDENNSKNFCNLVDFKE